MVTEERGESDSYGVDLQRDALRQQRPLLHYCGKVCILLVLLEQDRPLALKMELIVRRSVPGSHECIPTIVLARRNIPQYGILLSQETAKPVLLPFHPRDNIPQWLKKSSPRACIYPS